MKVQATLKACSAHGRIQVFDSNSNTPVGFVTFPTGSDFFVVSNSAADAVLVTGSYDTRTQLTLDRPINGYPALGATTLSNDVNFASGQPDHAYLVPTDSAPPRSGASADVGNGFATPAEAAFWSLGSTGYNLNVLTAIWTNQDGSQFTATGALDSGNALLIVSDYNKFASTYGANEFRPAVRSCLIALSLTPAQNFLFVPV